MRLPIIRLLAVLLLAVLLLAVLLLCWPLGLLAHPQMYQAEYQYSYNQQQQPISMKTEAGTLDYHYDHQGNRTLKQYKSYRQDNNHKSDKKNKPDMPPKAYAIAGLPVQGMHNLHFWPSSGVEGQALPPLELRALTGKSSKILWQAHQHAEGHWVWRTELGHHGVQKSFSATFVQAPANKETTLTVAFSKSRGLGFSIYSNGKRLMRIYPNVMKSTRTLQLEPGSHVLVFRAYRSNKKTAQPNKPTAQARKTGAPHYVEIHKLELSAATDSNNNHLADSLEYRLLHQLDHSLDTELSTRDTDQDGLTDLQELALSANPNASDSDADGLPDGYEHQQGWSLLHNNAYQDADQDGIWNIEEFLQGSDPQDPASGTALRWHFDDTSTPQTINSAVASPTGNLLPFWSATNRNGKFHTRKGAQNFGQRIINDQGEGVFRIHHALKHPKSLYLSTQLTSIGSWLRLSLRKKVGSQWGIYLNGKKQAYQSDCDQSTDVSPRWCTLELYIPKGPHLMTFQLKPLGAWAEIDNLFIPGFLEKTPKPPK